MKNYVMLELNNNNNYIVVDMLENNKKKYFLLTQVLDENNINNEFEIYTLDEENNSFEVIEDELEYNFIKENFNNRLNELRKKIEEIDKSMPNIIKLKVVDIDNFNYSFEKINGEKITMDIEIFGDFKIQVNDYMYILEDTTKENITIRFGSIYINDIEIIKIVRNEKSYYLQRYYG